MKQTCSISGCSVDKIYTVEKNDKIYRLTFSRSLADHICQNKPGFTQNRRTFKLGKELNFGEKSSSGLYAITKKNGWALRITMFKELADAWNHESRRIFECWLV